MMQKCRTVPLPFWFFHRPIHSTWDAAPNGLDMSRSLGMDANQQQHQFYQFWDVFGFLQHFTPIGFLGF